MSAPSQASEEQTAATFLGFGTDVAQCLIVTDYSVIHFVNDHPEASQITDAQFTDHINTTFDFGEVLWLSTGRDGSSRPTGSLNRTQAKYQLVQWTLLNCIGSHRYEADAADRLAIESLALIQAATGSPQPRVASSTMTADSASSRLMDDPGLLDPCKMM